MLVVDPEKRADIGEVMQMLRTREESLPMNTSQQPETKTDS